VALDTEITAASGKTKRGGGNSQLDSGHEPSEPVVGSTRIHGELCKLGIEVAPSTVAKYLHRPRKPPSQTWRTFLTNHVEEMASIDFFVVPTATFRVLFVFVVLSHARRRVLHFQVTEHPSQEWTMQQMREAFPWDQSPRYLLRDRDAIYGGDLVAMTKGMGMEEVLSAPRSPWQNPYAERLIGPYGANVWTTSSCGMKGRYAGLCKVILPTTSAPELIWRWPRTLRNREQWRSQNAGVL
jgi:transposase InsO family protein